MLIRAFAAARSANNRNVMLAQFPTLAAFRLKLSAKTRGPSPPPVRCTVQDTTLATASKCGSGSRMFGSEVLRNEREIVACTSVPGGNFCVNCKGKDLGAMTSIKKLSILVSIVAYLHLFDTLYRQCFTCHT